MRSFAFALLWLYVASVPLEGILVLPVLGSLGRALGGCAFLAWLVVLAQSERIRRPAPFHLLLFAFAFWGLLSYTLSIDPTLSSLRMGTLAQIPLMVWLIWELAAAPREQRSLMQAYCFGTALLCAQVASNYFSFIPLVGGYFTRYSAFDIDANMTALIIALAVPMAIYLTAAPDRQRLRWFNWALVPLAVFAIALTGSRSGALALIAALCYLPFVLTAVSNTKKVLLGIGLLAGVVVLDALISPELLERILTIPTEVQTVVEGDTMGANARILVWEKGLAVVPDHLLGGVGLGAFRTSVADSFRGGLGMGPHNSFIAVLVEEGIIGLGMFLGILGILAAGTRRMARLERWLCLSLMLTWSISVFFIQQHDKKHTWFVMGIIAALAGSAARRSSAPAPEQRAHPTR